MAEICRCWIDPGLLLSLWGVHRQHSGLCMSCCIKIAICGITSCPMCRTAFTPIEKAIISSVALHGSREAGRHSSQMQESEAQFDSAHTHSLISQSPEAWTQPELLVPHFSAQRLNSPCFQCSGNAGNFVKQLCGHVACRQHLKEYLTTQSQERKEIKCPYSYCTYIYPAHTIMLILDKEDFLKYRRSFLKNVMICPRADCRAIEQADKKNRIVQCSNCWNQYCSLCEKSKVDCRCEVPKEIMCKKCHLIMNPDCHRLMVCRSCRNIMCTFCSLDSTHCICNHNALNAILRIAHVAECEVCGEDMCVDEPQNLFAIEGCSHVYHRTCIIDYVTAKLESGEFSSELNCLKHGCAGKLGNFQQLVSANQWSLYERKLIESNFNLVQCPNPACREVYTIDEKVKSLTCWKCKNSFCLWCLEPQHDGSCSRAGILAKIRLLEATGEPVSQCPKCKLPYIKDEHCEHIKCMNPDCKVEFCFTCSCLRVPTVKHCNAWHRPNCKWYEGVGADTEKFRKDCPECVRLGKRCNPPKALRVPCRFDEDEE